MVMQRNMELESCVNDDCLISTSPAIHSDDVAMDENCNKTSSQSHERSLAQDEPGEKCCFNKQRKRSSVTSWVIRRDLSATNLSNLANTSVPSHSPRQKGNKPSFFFPSQEEMDLTVGLCRDYICCKLKRSGFGKKVYVTKYSSAKDQALSRSISTIGHSFETTYPSVYKNLSKKIGFVFDSEQTTKRLYFRLATHVIGFESKDFTWGRVLSLFCLAGAMALDCVLQGHSELVEEVVKFSSEYIKQNVLEWIVNQGGWKAMSEHFKQKKSNHDNKVVNIVTETKYVITTLSVVGLSILSTFAFHFFM